LPPLASARRAARRGRRTPPPRSPATASKAALPAPRSSSPSDRPISTRTRRAPAPPPSHLDWRSRLGKGEAMTRRGADDSSGEGTFWLVLRHTQAEGLGLLANALREHGVHHRNLDLPRGEPAPRELRGVGVLSVYVDCMEDYDS